MRYVIVKKQKTLQPFNTKAFRKKRQHLPTNTVLRYLT